MSNDKWEKTARESYRQQSYIDVHEIQLASLNAMFSSDAYQQHLNAQQKKALSQLLSEAKRSITKEQSKPSEPAEADSFNRGMIQQLHAIKVILYKEFISMVSIPELSESHTTLINLFHQHYAQIGQPKRSGFFVENNTRINVLRAFLQDSSLGASQEILSTLNELSHKNNGLLDPAISWDDVRTNNHEIEATLVQVENKLFQYVIKNELLPTDQQAKEKAKQYFAEHKPNFYHSYQLMERRLSALNTLHNAIYQATAEPVRSGYEAQFNQANQQLAQLRSEFENKMNPSMSQDELEKCVEDFESSAVTVEKDLFHWLHTLTHDDKKQDIAGDAEATNKTLIAAKQAYLDDYSVIKRENYTLKDTRRKRAGLHGARDISQLVQADGELPLSEVNRALGAHQKKPSVIVGAEVRHTGKTLMRRRRSLSFASTPMPGNLFPNYTVDLGDINQGSLGDCYLIATMASVAQTKMGAPLIASCMADLTGKSHLLGTREYEGKVLVRVFKRPEGHPSPETLPPPKIAYVLLDKTVMGGQEQANTGDLWLHMYEKAYAIAQRHGEWKELEGGFPYEVMKVFFNQYVEQQQMTKERDFVFEKMWDQCVETKNNIFVSTPDEAKKVSELKKERDAERESSSVKKSEFIALEPSAKEAFEFINLTWHTICLSADQKSKTPSVNEFVKQTKAGEKLPEKFQKEGDLRPQFEGLVDVMAKQYRCEQVYHKENDRQFQVKKDMAGAFNAELKSHLHELWKEKTDGKPSSHRQIEAFEETALNDQSFQEKIHIDYRRSGADRSLYERMIRNIVNAAKKYTYPNDAVDTLTTHEQSLLQIMSSSLAEHRPVTMSSRAQIGKESGLAGETMNVGVPALHAFSVKAVIHKPIGEGRVIPGLLLRNPWGKGVYDAGVVPSGIYYDYSKESNQLTPKILTHHEFWVPISEIVSNFHSYFVGQPQADYREKLRDIVDGCYRDDRLGDVLPLGRLSSIQAEQCPKDNLPYLVYGELTHEIQRLKKGYKKQKAPAEITLLSKLEKELKEIFSSTELDSFGKVQAMRDKVNSPEYSGLDGNFVNIDKAIGKYVTKAQRRSASLAMPDVSQSSAASDAELRRKPRSFSTSFEFRRRAQAAQAPIKEEAEKPAKVTSKVRLSPPIPEEEEEEVSQDEKSSKDGDAKEPSSSGPTPGS